MTETGDKILDLATRRQQAKANSEAVPPIDERPVVEIRGATLAENVKEIERLLIESGEPLIFQRRTNLVNIIRLPETKTIGGIKRFAGSPMINVISPAAMRRRMDEVIRFMKYDARAKGLVPKDPPEDYAKVLIESAGQWSFPPLHAVIETPTLRPDGSVLQTPGYDPETFIYFAPSIAFPPIPEQPSKDEAFAALGKIRWLLKDFPFLGKDMNQEGEMQDAVKTESVALASILTALIRRSLNIAPMFLFDAPTASSGKTLLSNVVASIATGRSASLMTWSGDPDEERKQLMALLQNGDVIGVYDNIDKPLGGAPLCKVLTSDVISNRQLGSNSAEARLVAPTCSTFIGTGNNIVVFGDARTRVLRCRIDPNMEHPEERNLDADALIRLIEDNRAKIVYACLIILRAYFAAGCPTQQFKSWRFPQWSNSVRSALVWLECEDPVATAKDVEDDDPSLSSAHAVLTELDLLLSNGSGKLAGEIKAAAEKKLEGKYGEAPSYERDGLRQALLNVAGDKGEIKTQTLGICLKNLDGAVFDDGKKKFVGEYDPHAKQKRWKIITPRQQQTDTGNAAPF
jgi:hypothetical protein